MTGPENKKIENAEQKEVIETAVEKPRNPNSISEVLSIGKDLQTAPDKVYRSVQGKEAIDDLERIGVVRNRQSAGLVKENRWGDRVFWSKGAEGKYHTVPQNSYVIEAPLAVAEERVVERRDVSAIYKKNETGEVVNILEEERIQREQEKAEQNEARIQELRKSLGADENK